MPTPNTDESSAGTPEPEDKYLITKSPDGKWVIIQCWGMCKPFSQKDLLTQIRRINPDVELSQVIYSPGYNHIEIKVPVVKPQT